MTTFSESAARAVEREIREDVRIWLVWARDHARLIGIDIDEHVNAAIEHFKSDD